MRFLEKGIDEGSWGGQAACVGSILPLHLTGKTKQQTGKLTICILLLQGIPLGLIHSVPLVLGKKEVKEAPAPKLWPYHKYHQYNDISKVTIIPILTPVSSVQRSSKVSYEEQAKFSISSYPFSMKLLWAPLVDSIYVARSYNLATFKIEICQLLCFNFAQLLLSGLAGESLGWFQFST